MNYLLFVFFCCLIISCVGDLSPVSNKREYFNIENYFTEEAAKLTQREYGITKTLFQNNTSETLTFESIDWNAELKPFMDISLNKPALVNSYRVDSVFKDGKKEIIFTARDDAPTLKSMKIIFRGIDPDTIIAINTAANMYYRSRDTLFYFGNGNYRISSLNKPRIGKEVSFVLEGRSEYN